MLFLLVLRRDIVGRAGSIQKYPFGTKPGYVEQFAHARIASIAAVFSGIGVSVRREYCHASVGRWFNDEISMNLRCRVGGR